MALASRAAPPTSRTACMSTSRGWFGIPCSALRFRHIKELVLRIVVTPSYLGHDYSTMLSGRLLKIGISVALLPLTVVAGRPTITITDPFGVSYLGVRNTTNKQDMFLSIPYAKPPVGALRFRPPQPWAQCDCGSFSLRPNCSVWALAYVRGLPSSKYM